MANQNARFPRLGGRKHEAHRGQNEANKGDRPRKSTMAHETEKRENLVLCKIYVIIKKIGLWIFIESN